MTFYEGAMQYETLMSMPITELLEWLEHAEEIAEERNKEAKKHGK